MLREILKTRKSALVASERQAGVLGHHGANRSGSSRVEMPGDPIRPRPRNHREGVMSQELPKTMKAAAIDRFGGVDAIHVEDVTVPEVGPDEVLIRVETAGVAVW